MAKQTILLVGSDTLAYSLLVCLRKAGQAVIFKTENVEHTLEYLSSHVNERQAGGAESEDLKVVTDYNFSEDIKLVIAVTAEDLHLKAKLIRELESHVSTDTIIAINTESIALHLLQNDMQAPERILGANWVEPAYTTFFLEIIANSVTSQDCIAYLKTIATERWSKDPYVITGESGIRAQLLAALIREAFYLVTNDYATVEDVDRACRNDAGYYMPFAGNLRYMDLMGTYAYGMVMEDLNRELAKDGEVPAFFASMIRNGESGMQSGRGFYHYQPGEAGKWKGLLKQFSEQIGMLIDKYPFKYKKEMVD